MRARSLLCVLTFVGVCGAASACVINEPEAPTRGVVVNGPPPPPVQEVPSQRPNPESIWVQGYWHWTGIQYAWIPGHWEAPPDGSRWTPPVYSMRDGKHVYESGGWRRPQNAIR